MKILVTGGTGYLGQFIVKELTSDFHEVAIAYHTFQLSESDLHAIGSPTPVRIDQSQSIENSGLNSVLENFGTPDVVINCAAISVPRHCEADPAKAKALNVPESLVDWILTLPNPNSCLLIHLSTDQVYQGTKAYYSESDETLPVNTYGETKVSAEALIREKSKNFIILRSSIIVGPSPPIPLTKGLPLQWIDSTLASKTETTFFEDEFRCPVFVGDIVRVVKQGIKKHNQGTIFQDTFNMGGPQRLSRADMAETVSRVRGHDTRLVKRASAKDVDRGVVSPADISMDVTRLVKTFGLELTKFEDAVALALG